MSRGNEVQPAWRPRLGLGRAELEGFSEDMWAAGKYEGPKPARPRLSAKGSSAAAQPVPTNMSASRLLLLATRATMRSLPSVYSHGLQAKIGQRFIWRIDSELLALGGPSLSRQVVLGGPSETE